MAMSKSRELIAEFVHSGVMHREDLSFSQKCDLISAKLAELAECEKHSLISDIDRDSILPDLIDNLIKKEFKSLGALMLLRDALIKVFIQGDYFNREIDADFRDEWIDQRPKQDENFIADFMERTRAAQWGQKC